MWYFTKPSPADSLFIDGLVDVMNRITADLIVACAPIQTGQQCANIESGVDKYNNISSNCANCLYLGTSNMDRGLGCYYHPSKTFSQNIANIVIIYINEILSL